MANVIKPLSFWVQKVLPLVYDDSLSYYEVVDKCVEKINELIACCDEVQTWKDEFADETEALRKYIDEKLSSQNIDATVEKLLTEYISSGLLLPYIDGELSELVDEAIQNMYQGKTLDILTDVHEVPFDLVGGRYIDVWVRTASAYYTTNENAQLYLQLAEAKNKLTQAKKPKNYPESYTTHPECLSLLHFSDIHGDTAETARIYIRFVELCSAVDNIICTGDFVPAWAGQDVSYLNAYQYGKATLRCIGNHDVYATPTPDLTNHISQTEQYNKYFNGYIQNWGVVYEAGKTYYYKDYDAKNIRLICLNDTLDGSDMTAQLSWLAGRLIEALAAGKSVLIAIHNMPNRDVTPVKSTFTRPDIVPRGYTSFETADAILNSVQSFINSGGDFIGYLCGHWHSDYIGYYNNYPEQMIFMVSAASRSQCNAVGDYDRVDDTVSMDLFNLFVADTSVHCFKLIRVGADYTSYLQHVDTVTVNYKTHEIMSN